MKTKLEKLYNSGMTGQAIAKELGISRTKLYKLIQFYDIKLKSELSAFDRWAKKVGLPVDEDEYIEKWKYEEGRPLNRWYRSDKAEALYCATKEPVKE